MGKSKGRVSNELKPYQHSPCGRARGPIELLCNNCAVREIPYHKGHEAINMKDFS